MSCGTTQTTIATAPVVQTGTSIGNIAWGIALGLILFLLIIAVIGLIIGAFVAPSATSWVKNSVV